MAEVAHPHEVVVKVRGGEDEVVVRPWTMAQRAAIRPRLSALIEKVQEQGGATGSLQAVFEYAEDEIAGIVRATLSDMPQATWEGLYWEDLPSLAQAIWQTSIIRDDGGGIAGKLTGVLGGLLGAPRSAPSITPPTEDESATPSTP